MKRSDWLMLVAFVLLAIAWLAFQFFVAQPWEYDVR